MKTSYIPQKQEILGYEPLLKNMEYAIAKNIPVLMIGETGVGKTAVVRHLAYTKKQNFRRLNLNGQTTIDEFVGKMLLNDKGTFWQDGILTEAMREGHWLLLDEVNAALPEILFVLHSLLDDDKFIVLSEKNGEVVRPHENFRIFATMNPSGRYAGTKELNKAFLSRFPMILQVSFPTPLEEAKIISHYAPTAKEADVKALVDMANQIRKGYEKDEINFVLSTRDLINCAMMAQDLQIDEAILLSVLNRVEKDDIKSVSTIVRLYFGAGVIRKDPVSIDKDMQKAVAYIADNAVDLMSKMDDNLQKTVTYENELYRFLEDIKDSSSASEPGRNNAKKFMKHIEDNYASTRDLVAAATPIKIAYTKQINKLQEITQSGTRKLEDPYEV